MISLLTSAFLFISFLSILKTAPNIVRFCFSLFFFIRCCKSWLPRAHSLPLHKYSHLMVFYPTLMAPSLIRRMVSDIMGHLHGGDAC
jgi:hypothetical protein